MNRKEVLKTYFGYDYFRGDQEKIIDNIIAGENILAVMPTGGGKSLCYQVPSILCDSFAIVISPLIALMKDQVDAANKLIKFAGFINSSIDYFTQEKTLSAVFEGKIKLLYVSPEKLESIQFAERIKELKPEYLFVDEAHCISEWGHNFRPSYRKINSFAKFTGIEKISGFTATATPEVRQDIIKQLGISNPKLFVSGFARENLSINVIRTSHKKENGLEILTREKGPAIIYSATRKFAEEFNDHIRTQGVNSAVYHAGIPDEMRKMIQEDFLEGKLDYIVATNAFGMGIDKSNIRTVIHLHMPGSIENYYQEIGRAGRDGKESKVFLLFDERDINIQKYFIQQGSPDYEQIETVYNTICNYYKIAVGNGYTKKLELVPDLVKLLDVRGINKSLLEASLRILSRLEYFTPAENNSNKNKFRFILSDKELKRFVKKIASRDLKVYVIQLLRKYGSDSFFRKVTLDFEGDTETTGFSVEYIKTLLNNLFQTGIIELETPVIGEVFKLNGTRVHPHALNIDTGVEEEFKNRMVHKLDSIVSFCYTEGCRTSFILKYFGDTVNEICGKCDNCISCEPKVDGLDFIKDKVLHLLNECRLSLKVSDITSFLKNGKSRRKIISKYGGTCSHFSKEEIESAINNLAVKGYISIFSEIAGLADKGKNYLSVDVILEPELSVSTSGYEEKLEIFNKLKELRKTASRKYNQQERMIINDDILKILSEKKPSTRAEILSIEGFTPRMYNKIGEDILEVFVEMLQKRKDITTGDTGKIPDNLIETYKLIKKGNSVEDISKYLNMPETIVSIQVETILKYDRGLKIDHLFDTGELDLINEEILKGKHKLKQLKSSLPDIDYSKLRIALAAILD